MISVVLLLGFYLQIVSSFGDHSASGGTCPFHKKKQNSQHPGDDQICGKLDFYYYQEIKTYEGRFSKGCRISMLKLTQIFKNLFPESNNTRFVTSLGLPFEDTLLKLDEGNSTMLIGLDNDDNFVWPVLTPWEKFIVPIQGQDVIVTPVSSSPRILLLDNLLTDEELDHIYNVAVEQKKKMERSTVGDHESKTVLDTRTSSHTWIGHRRGGNYDGFYTDDIVERIESKMFEFGRSPIDGNLAESMQCVFYDKTQHYFLHRDYTNWDDDNDNPYHTGGGNRFATLLLYINDVEEGGETLFPYVDPNGQPINREKVGDLDRWEHEICDRNDLLKVTPKRGRIVIFYSMVEKGNFINTNQSSLDQFSLHMGCPVKSGEKFVSNTWLRNKEVNGHLF